jgi:hypothetical protein
MRNAKQQEAQRSKDGQVSDMEAQQNDVVLGRQQPRADGAEKGILGAFKQLLEACVFSLAVDLLADVAWVAQQVNIEVKKAGPSLRVEYTAGTWIGISESHQVQTSNTANAWKAQRRNDLRCRK